MLAANADSASAQTVGQATTASRGTVYTGDTIDGKKVINALNIGDLEPGKKHLFYFQGVQMATGQHWHVSTMVAKGTRPGKRIALVSGVHGDEISPVRTIQTGLDRLNPVEMSGGNFIETSELAVEFQPLAKAFEKRGLYDRDEIRH